MNEWVSEWVCSSCIKHGIYCEHSTLKMSWSFFSLCFWSVHLWKFRDGWRCMLFVYTYYFNRYCRPIHTTFMLKSNSKQRRRQLRRAIIACWALDRELRRRENPFLCVYKKNLMISTAVNNLLVVYSSRQRKERRGLCVLQNSLLIRSINFSASTSRLVSKSIPSNVSLSFHS